MTDWMLITKAVASFPIEKRLAIKTAYLEYGLDAANWVLMGCSIKAAKVNIKPIRQRTQYTCVAASVCMALQANGVRCTEDQVNEVLGCQPLRGASWEAAVAALQYFGQRALFVCPTEVTQLKAWTDEGVPVLIGWNPEGRPWAHASLVIDVSDHAVSVADPNIPDPSSTVRTVPIEEFYKKWMEDYNGFKVRRPALAVFPEVTEEGEYLKDVPSKMLE